MIEVVPRILRERSVGKLPLLPYSAMASQGMVWTFYGLLRGNPAIWTPNALAMVLGLFYSAVYCRFCPKDADWLPRTPKHHVAGFLATTLFCGIVTATMDPGNAFVAMGLMGNVMTLAMFGGPLAAMRTVVRERSTRSMPFGFTCAVALNCALWFFYAFFMLDDVFIYFQDGLGLVFAGVQFALFARFGIYRAKR